MGCLTGLGHKTAKKKVKLMVAHPARQRTSHLLRRPRETQTSVAGLWLSSAASILSGLHAELALRHPPPSPKSSPFPTFP